MDADGLPVTEVTEDRLRRARRWLVGFRVLFYGGAALAAALLIASGSSGAPALGPVFGGNTDQQRALVIELDGDGRPRSVVTELTATCPNGYSYPVGWRALAGTDATFEIDGDAFAIRARRTLDYRNGRVGEQELTVRGRLDGESASGTVWIGERVRVTRGRDFVCESGPVGFFVRD